MAEDKIMEALARIEHKLDILLRWVNPSMGTTQQKLPQLSDSNNCPVCSKPVAHNVDINDSVVVRKCGCSTGKIALDLKSFAPTSPKRKHDAGRDDEQEDRNDPDDRSRRLNRK